MDICPNCKSKLNIDEKSSGRCFSCGTTFEATQSKIKELEQIYKNNLITLEEYNNKRKEILDKL